MENLQQDSAINAKKRKSGVADLNAAGKRSHSNHGGDVKFDTPDATTNDQANEQQLDRDDSAGYSLATEESGTQAGGRVGLEQPATVSDSPGGSGHATKDTIDASITHTRRDHKGRRLNEPLLSVTQAGDGGDAADSDDQGKQSGAQDEGDFSTVPPKPGMSDSQLAATVDDTPDAKAASES